MSLSANPLTVTVSANSSLIAQAKNVLGPDYHLVDCLSYVGIIHPHFGAAAIVSNDNLKEAESAAAEMNLVFTGAEIPLKAIPLGVSETTVKPPVIIRAGPQMATDIAVSMGRASVTQDELTEQQVMLARKALELHIRSRKPKVLDPSMLAMIKAAVAKVTFNAKIFCGGPEVDVEEVVMPEFLLPAILYSTLENWTLPVTAQKGKGGFQLDLQKDEAAVLMYRVTGLEVSSPLLLLLPLVDVLRRQKRGGEFVLDPCIERFGNFITSHLTPDMETSLEVRIATSG